PSIAAYVSSIVVLEHSNMSRPAVLPLIAKGYPSIAFQVTDTARLPNAASKMDNLVLYGQNIQPINLHIAGHATVIAYFLYPFVLKTLFGWDAKALTDLHIDLALTAPARGMSLKEQLLNAPDLSSRLQLLNGYVQKLSANSNPAVNDTIAFATQVIQKSRGLAPITSLQKELYVTERTLQRMFELHVGVSPKTFSRICQFNAALQQLSGNRFSGMANVAYHAGYADQSHLIRAFKSFTSYSPLEYHRLAVEFPQ
ncbi:MAG TPA: helix-turn-helix transcriptional regulator, partial [Chitinophaga sp.]|uniref:helix-turn-helix transcriptional regulator n=1 Tax=Chitinophaga sp. TaxID=1869181 RepID=UPI002DBA6BCA